MVETVIDRWPDTKGVLLVGTLFHSKTSGKKYIGPLYKFYPNGSPMHYVLYNLEGQVVGTEYRFHKNGRMSHFSQWENSLVTENKEWSRKGVLTTHHLYLDGRFHGEQIINTKHNKRTYYCHKGVEVEKRLLDNPELITTEMLLSERNVETRRIYLDLIGTENFLDRFDYEVLDIDTVRGADTLYKFDLGQTVHMVKFVCPSTADVYFHFVPTFCRTIERAKCWMFGLDGHSFKPAAEA